MGVLLLAAAGLKAYGLAVDPVGGVGPFSSPVFQVAVTELEILLGIWLLWGRQPIAAWLTTLATFAAFAGASLLVGSAGQASCGCLGKVSLNPWYAFFIDLAALAVLVRARPDLTPLWNDPRAVFGRPALVLAGVTVVSTFVGIAFVFVAQTCFGSVAGALSLLRGERISIQPLVVDTGRGSPGTLRESRFRLFNHTDEPVHVIGCKSDCSCIVSSDLPLTIPPHETESLTVKVRLPAVAGIFRREGTFLTNASAVRFTVVGDATNNTDSEKVALTAISGNGPLTCERSFHVPPVDADILVLLWSGGESRRYQRVGRAPAGTG